ncbi:hypothetical protein Tco_1295747 [Tanacetum coccineum]
MMQGASFTQGKVPSIPTVFSWDGSISPDSFLSSILLMVVVIVAIVIVVVTVILVVVVVVIIGIVVVVVIIGINCALGYDPLASGLCWWLPPEFEALKQ